MNHPTNDIADRERTADSMIDQQIRHGRPSMVGPPKDEAARHEAAQEQQAEIAKHDYRISREGTFTPGQRANGGATFKSIAFLVRLVAERGDAADAEQARSWAVTRQQREVSGQIDRLKPTGTTYAGSREERSSSQVPRQITVTETGIYVDGDDIYAVVPNKAGERLYAKKVVESPSERLTEAGERVSFEFEYAPGAIYRLTPQMRLTAEQAKALQLRFNRCLMCRRALKVAKSVERGIGPVCARRMGF